jgi:hypothetical protein
MVSRVKSDVPRLTAKCKQNKNRAHEGFDRGWPLAVVATSSSNNNILTHLVSSPEMLRRVPSGSANNSGDPSSLSLRSGFGIIAPRPFKVPTPAAPVSRSSVLPQRKRKRISYKEDGQQDDKENDGDVSDEEGAKKKGSRFTMGNKEYGPDGVLGDMAKYCNRKFPKFEVKPKEAIFAKQ